MAKVSVLLPVYYKESVENLHVCLASIENQTLVPDEIVLALDEPSNSEIESEIEKFSSKTSISVRRCYIKRGSGLGAVLRCGVENCTGDYIARMDVDDIAVPHRLEKQKNFLDQYEEIDVIGSNIAEFEQSKNEIIAYRNVPEADEACKEMLKRRDPINHMTAMYRKESIMKAGNYSVDMKSCEDTYLWTAFYAHGLRFANIQECLVYAHAGKDMYERRAKSSAYYFVKKSIDYKYDVGLISFWEGLFQKIANYFILIVMNAKMRAFIYENILRKKNG